MHGQQTSKSSL